MLLYSEYVSMFHSNDSYFICRYKRAEDAKMALEQMEGFELAGRTVSFSQAVT